MLELACGTGEVAAALSGRVAQVLATDFAPGMVEATKRRELAGVEARVMDMQELDLADDSFDKVVCRFGYMLVPDRARAFRETRRVLRAGGRLAFATWAAAKRNPWATAFGPSLVARGLMEAPAPGEPSQFALGEAAAIEDEVRAAGFEEIDVTDVGVELRVAGWEAYVELQTGMSTLLREALEAADDADRAVIDAEARARFEPYRTRDGYVVPGVALVTRAA